MTLIRVTIKANNAKLDEIDPDFATCGRRLRKILILQILDHMKENRPLDQPSGCPHWVYILMHQCWTYEPTQRPPFIAITDCLSRRYGLLC